MEKKVVVEIDGVRHDMVEDMTENYQCKDCSLVDVCGEIPDKCLCWPGCHFEKERWKPKQGDTIWAVTADGSGYNFYCFEITCAGSHDEVLLPSNWFQTEAEAQAVCDKLNAAIKPIVDELNH